MMATFAEERQEVDTIGLNGPLFTIVTPSFNQARFLRRTIESVLEQDYSHVQYLVMDGGSTDQSLDILRSYDGRFFWVSETDRGQAHAVNKGLLLAQGEILGFLNSDDVLLPGALSTVAEYFENHPDCDVLYGAADFIDENGRRLGRYETASFDRDKLLENCFLCQPATFWRRRVIEKFGLLDETLHYALDYEYWLRLAFGGARFSHLPLVLAQSRCHPQTKTVCGKLSSYREVLQAGRRHGNQAGYSQYFAYWHHRCHERRRGWPSWLRWWPSSHYWLSLTHYRWDQTGRRVLPFLGRVLRGAGRRIGRRFGLRRA